MAFTKEEKIEIMESYEKWLTESKAVFLVEYSRMSMKEVDEFRARAREAGGEMHVVKNTLFGIVMDKLGLDSKDFLERTTIVGFAYNDAPGMAKIINDATKSDNFSVKGGYLGKRTMTIDEVKALATLPPLPVVRAQLLGLLNAPASRLVRTLAEPARGLASVVRAYSETENEAAPAA